MKKSVFLMAAVMSHGVGEVLRTDERGEVVCGKILFPAMPVPDRVIGRYGVTPVVWYNGDFDEPWLGDAWLCDYDRGQVWTYSLCEDRHAAFIDAADSANRAAEEWLDDMLTRTAEPLADPVDGVARLHISFDDVFPGLALRVAA